MSEAEILPSARLSVARAAAPAAPHALFFYTRSQEPCGVETFTRTLVNALSEGEHDAACELVSVSGRWRDVPALLHRILQADQVVFSFPLVAWKRMLAIPLVLLLFAFVTRRSVSTFAHEWNGLHWLRRVVLIPYIWLSRTILVLSPLIREEIARDPWIGRPRGKCRLVPHPPTVPRPDAQSVTGTVHAVEEAGRDADIVIGHFGAIYQGKATIALLELCDHLRGRGIRAQMVFIGSFTKSLDGYEARFRARVRELGLEDSVIVTGYVSDTAELFALFERIGVFLFLFPEGLTARRSSVITCLQSHKPVVVSAPQSLDEFRHHGGLTALIQSGALSFVPRSAGTAEIAEELLAAIARPRDTFPAIDAAAWWAATTDATRAAL
jgi:glycosyltransferase involved in cell wall biosynthesis